VIQFLHGSPLKGKKPQPRCEIATFKATIHQKRLIDCATRPYTINIGGPGAP
jgi:hypothetical protein